MKKVLHRQETKYGCGSYTLANLFNDKRFIQQLPTCGERVADLNRKMAKYKRSIFVNPIYVTCNSFPYGNRLLPDLANHMFEIEPPEGLIKPMVITFARPNGNLHSVGLLQQNDMGYIVDSCETEVETGRMIFFVHKLNIVHVNIFTAWEGNPSNEIMMPKEYFSHII